MCNVGNIIDMEHIKPQMKGSEFYSRNFSVEQRWKELLLPNLTCVKTHSGHC